MKRKIVKKINNVTVYCPYCKEDVNTQKRAFNVIICPQCHKILASDIAMEKAR